jgi:predicted Zn-dependent protease
VRYAISTLFALTLCAQQPATPAKEAALGKELAAQVRRDVTVIEIPEVTAYVEQVGHRLAAAMPKPGVSYTFAVIQDDPTGPPHEPLTFPGGYIFVSARLLLAARKEAEFAGMLAGAMPQETTGLRIRVGSPGPVIYVPRLEDALGRRFVTELRDQVRQADAIAAQAMSKAGWDPRALAEYIGREQPEGPRDTPSARPPRAERVAALEEIVARLPAGGVAANPEFDQVQALVRSWQPPARRAPSLRRP